MKRVIKDNAPIPPGPFESEEGWRAAERRVKDQQRKSSGGLPDDPADNPVRNGPKPFKNLKGR